MTKKRKSIPIDVKRLVLHEGGYKCANPVCRTPLTLDIHHIEYVSDGGTNDPNNLLALCPNCHTLHHSGIITSESIRSWKMLLLSLNEGFDRRSVDLLLALKELGPHYVDGGGVLQCASLIASGLVCSKLGISNENGSGSCVSPSFTIVPKYTVQLTDKGRNFVEAWREGNQMKAVGGMEEASINLTGT